MIDDNFWKKDLVFPFDFYKLFDIDPYEWDLEDPAKRLSWDLCHAALHAIDSKYKRELVLREVYELYKKLKSAPQ
jgi:hypothetical protein